MTLEKLADQAKIERSSFNVQRVQLAVYAVFLTTMIILSVVVRYLSICTFLQVLVYKCLPYFLLMFVIWHHFIRGSVCIIQRIH